jgi:DNA polymerase III epsilon subunit-like protein
MLGGWPGLCTLRLSRHLFPELRSHALQALRHELALPMSSDPGDAHRALSDVRVTATILEILLERYLGIGFPPDTDALLAYTESRVRFPRFPFGRYRHVPLSKVPAGYLYWMLRATDPPFDPDVRATVGAELKRRHAVADEQVREAV